MAKRNSFNALTKLINSQDFLSNDPTHKVDVAKWRKLGVNVVAVPVKVPVPDYTGLTREQALAASLKYSKSLPRKHKADAGSMEIDAAAKAWKEANGKK